MLRTIAVVAVLVLTAAACASDEPEATTTTAAVSTTTTIDLGWSEQEIADLVALCVQDARNRSTAFPEVPYYTPDEAPAMCADDVEILRLQDCTLAKAALVLTDWDEDNSPLQCPAG